MGQVWRKDEFSLGQVRFKMLVKDTLFECRYQVVRYIIKGEIAYLEMSIWELFKIYFLTYNEIILFGCTVL